MLPSDLYEKTKMEINLIKNFTPFAILIAVVIGILPFLSFFLKEEIPQIASAFYLIMFAYVGLTSLIIHLKAVNPMIREIDHHIAAINKGDNNQKEPLQVVVYKMKLARFSMISTTPPVFTMYILLAFVPYLKRNSGYVFPFFFMVGAFIAFFLTFSIMNKSVTQSSIGANSKIIIRKETVSHSSNARPIFNESSKAG